MTSYLINIVLLGALAITAWRTGRMYKELRTLRDGESGLGAALEAADQSINRAAHAVVVLKHEGVRTLKALEACNDEGRALAERLEALIARADHHCAGTAGAAVQRVAAPSIVPALFPTITTAGKEIAKTVSHQPRAVGQTRAHERASSITQ
ncbi:hypothetical protein [Mangrovicella endophytica]|uniref:hypothetical protein n=1 Tax=Mangrovicella endophytica TaxID=2066697 RepID=UPI000C9EC44F|nr:hypothetical protein [Mangrovicella endophytica]